MQVLVGIFMAVMALSVILPDEHRGFLTLTHVSVWMLILTPRWFKRPLGNVGIYVHEICHGLAAIATGGRFHQFYVTRNHGAALSSGGNVVLRLVAGYIGTVFIGIYVLALATCVFGLPHIPVYILAAVFLAATVKAADKWTAFVGVALAVVLVGCTFLDLIVHAFILNFIGVLILYDGIASIIDLHNAAKQNKTTGTSDIDSLSQVVGCSPVFWSFTFICISAVTIITVFGYVFS